MVCDHKSLTVINNSFVFSSKIIRECFTGAENDSLYQSTVPLPRQNKAARSCGGTSTAASTGDLVFPFPSQTHFVGLCDGIGSDMDCPGAPRQKNSAPFRFRGLRKSRENCTSAVSVFLSNSDPLALGSELAENDRCSTDDSCLPLSLEVNASRPNRTMGTTDDKLNYSLTGSG